jgi:glutamate racemase
VHGIKLLVVACNTASALALPAIREAVSVPVVGVIGPGARAAVAAAAGKSIAIIATEATVQSRAYSRAISAIEPQASVIERACPLFVPLAEEGWVDTHVTRDIAAQYLSELPNESLGALVMGCTHYPILRAVIAATVGDGVPLIDSGEATAREVEVLLHSKGIAHAPRESLAEERKLCDDLDHFYVTDAAERFAKVAERFLGSAPSVLEAVEVWGHDELRTH